jgi:hypothetical protein
MSYPTPFIPAKAGIQIQPAPVVGFNRVPASAGMSGEGG